MILSDKKIIEGVEKGDIIITPFDLSNMGGNSYDVHLNKNLAQYIDKEIDAKKHNQVRHFEIPKEGFVLKPGELYLGTTLEYTETHKHVPYLDGKSSTGRLGINIHATAGRGDVGFCGFWTLELSTNIPIHIYAGMPIGQLTYHTVEGEVERMYNKKETAKYNNKENIPKESMMWKNFV